MLKLVVDNAHAAQAQEPVPVPAVAQAVPPDKSLVTIDPATDTFHFNLPDKAAPEPVQTLLAADAAPHPLDVHTAPEAAQALPEATPVVSTLDPLQMLAHHDHGVFA